MRFLSFFELCEVLNEPHVGSYTGLPVLDYSDSCFPSNLNPASKEMISDSVEVCETEVCFLHIQLIGTIVRLPKIHKNPPRGRFRIFKVSSKV